MRVLSAVALALAVTGCASNPPSHWMRGGAGLDLRAVAWANGASRVELAPTGEGRVDGEAEFTLDRRGRVWSDGGDVYALLEPDGRLLGGGDTVLGRVDGSRVRGGDGSPYLTLSAEGHVVRHASDGDRSLGRWSGCDDSSDALRAC